MRSSLLLLIGALALAPAGVGAQAREGQPRDGTALARAVAEEALRAWNDPATRRSTGRTVIAAGEQVAGDLAVLEGELTIGGSVDGRVVAINGDVRLLPGGRVGNGILIVGGNLHGRDEASVTGDVRIYEAALAYERRGDVLVRQPSPDEGPRWWQRRDRWHRGVWSDLRLVSARTYNRVEGLPLHIGPRLGRDFRWGRAVVDGYGILRSADGFEWKPENLGHSLRSELQFGRESGIRIGGRLFNEVQPVEDWHLDDSEIGLASFFLHRDFRDYFNRHGGALTASVFGHGDVDVSMSYSDQRWAARRTRDPWTVFRNEERWRQNPALDEGRFHVVETAVRYDTRNDVRNPWSGWFVQAHYEYGTGRIDRYAATTPDVRDLSPGGATSYDRVFFDVRRYNRLSPGTQLNVRLVGGGWLSGDDLPLQRRFSLGGPGSLPGYDFRRQTGDADALTCNTIAVGVFTVPQGTPGQCERFALAQFEYHGDVHFDPFGVLDEDREWRRSGWGRGTQWVLFSDIGRGWLVGERNGALTYGTRTIPRLSTFRVDVGLGLVLDDIGVYASHALTRAGHGVNFTVRLRPRF